MKGLIRHLAAIRQYSTVLSNSVTKHIEQLSLNPQATGKPTHISLDTPKDFDYSLLGTFWARSIHANGKSELTAIADASIKDYNVLAFGGIGFYQPRHLSALLKSLETLSPKTRELKSAAVFHNATPDTRFQAAIKYNEEKLYYAPYIEDFTRKYVLPRFVDTNGKLTTPNMPLFFYTFSIGGREVMMVENCLRTILEKEYHCTPSNIHALFTHLRALSIGYALDYNNLPEPRFAKTVVFSVDELGVQRTKELARDIAANKDIFIQKISCTSLKTTPLVEPTHLFTFGYNVVPIVIEQNKITDDFHSLTHYMAAIVDTPQIQTGLLDILGLVDRHASTTQDPE